MNLVNIPDVMLQVVQVVGLERAAETPEQLDLDQNQFFRNQVCSVHTRLILGDRVAATKKKKLSSVFV